VTGLLAPEPAKQWSGDFRFLWTCAIASGSELR